MIRRRRRRAGLSLLEVIVALAIFLIALVGLSQLMSICTDQAIEIGNMNRATQLLQSKMNEAIAGAVPLSGQGETAFDEDPDWYWSMDATAHATPGLYEVTVTVIRKTPSGDVAGTWSLNQLVLDPAVRGTIEAPPASTPAATDPAMQPATPPPTSGGP